MICYTNIKDKIDLSIFVNKGSPAMHQVFIKQQWNAILILDYFNLNHLIELIMSNLL